MFRLQFSLVLFLGSWLSAGAALQPDQKVILEGGQWVRILSAGEIQYSSGENAYFLRYQTSCTQEQRKALSEEVDALWGKVQPEVEASGLNQVVICSDYQCQALFWTSHATTNFIFEKGPDGKWQRVGRAEFVAAQ